MAYVRKKRIKGKDYFYLVKNIRDGKKVRQKTLAYLGQHPTLEKALAAYTQELEKLHGEMEKLEAEKKAAGRNARMIDKLKDELSEYRRREISGTATDQTRERSVEATKKLQELRQNQPQSMTRYKREKEEQIQALQQMAEEMNRRLQKLSLLDPQICKSKKTSHIKHL